VLRTTSEQSAGRKTSSGQRLRFLLRFFLLIGDFFLSFLSFIFFLPFYLPHLLGAFTKLRKATLSLVLSVRPHGTTRFQMD